MPKTASSNSGQLLFRLRLRLTYSQSICSEGGGKIVTSACGSPCLLLWTIEAEKLFYVSII